MTKTEFERKIMHIVVRWISAYETGTGSISDISEHVRMHIFKSQSKCTEY